MRNVVRFRLRREFDAVPHASGRLLAKTKRMAREEKEKCVMTIVYFIDTRSN